MKYLVWNKKENRAATPYELEKLHDTDDQQIFASWETHPQVLNAGVVEINLEYSSEGEFEIRAVEKTSDESAAFPLHGASASEEHDKPQHCCGLTGFNPMLGDTCPACEAARTCRS